MAEKVLTQTDTYNVNFQGIYQFVPELNFFFAGFLPRDTAKHHQANVLTVLREALDQANIDPKHIDVVCYTKGNFFFGKSPWSNRYKLLM